MSFEFPGAKAKSAGAPIDIIFPSEGSGWEAEATAIIAGTANLEAAKTLLDWSVTKEANEMYNVGYAVVAYPGVAKAVEHLPADVSSKMIDNDFEWAAAATREAVGLFDQTSFAKLLVQGRDAAMVLNRICAAEIDVAIGRSIYTGLLNERGGYESDLTVLRLASDRFLLITGSA